VTKYPHVVGKDSTVKNNVLECNLAYSNQTMILWYPTGYF